MTLLGDICKKFDIEYGDISHIRLKESENSKPVVVTPDRFFLTERTDFDVEKWPYLYFWMKDGRFHDITYGDNGTLHYHGRINGSL